MTGIILFALGLFSLGWLVEVIPYIPVSAFITAASISIMCTQLPVLLGIHGVNTREEPYKVFISTMKNLGGTKLDAAIGITCLVLLELAKYVFAKLEARQPARKKMWSIMSSLRLTFAMVLYTLVSFLVNRNLKEDQSKFRIVGHINQGRSISQHYFHQPLTHHRLRPRWSSRFKTRSHWRCSPSEPHHHYHPHCRAYRHRQKLW